MKPSRLRRFSSARSAASRGAVSPRALRSSNDWNRASNMRSNVRANVDDLESMTPSPGGGGSASIERCEPGWGVASRKSPHPAASLTLFASGDPPHPGEGRTALEHQSRPAIDLDAPLQRKLPVSGERGIGLRLQQTRQDEAAARRNDLAQRRGELLQRPEQDVGKDQIERGADVKVSCGEPIGAADADQAGGPIK